MNSNQKPSQKSQVSEQPRVFKFYEGDVIGKDCELIEHAAYLALQEKHNELQKVCDEDADENKYEHSQYCQSLHHCYGKEIEVLEEKLRIATEFINGCIPDDEGYSDHAHLDDVACRAREAKLKIEAIK